MRNNERVELNIMPGTVNSNSIFKDSIQVSCETIVNKEHFYEEFKKFLSEYLSNQDKVIMDNISFK